jgi:asparagine synthase (glutamine-hydrolysing)
LGQKLVDYVCRLPGAVLAPPRTKPKHVLREAIKDLLPPHIFTRPKTGFILPIDSWMDGELKDLCESAIDSLAASPALDGKEVRKLWEQLNDKRFESFYWRRLAMVVLGKYLGSDTG